MKKNDLKLPGDISVQKLFGTEPGTEQACNNHCGYQ